MNSSGKILAAFLAGAAAGASLGILFAPEKGEQTRESIKGSFDELTGKAKEAYEKAQSAFNDFKTEAKKAENTENTEK